MDSINQRKTTPQHFKRNAIRYWLMFLALSLIPWGCSLKKVSRELRQVDEIKSTNLQNKYLKAHMTNGDLYLLHTWKIDKSNRMMFGFGNHLDYNRQLIERRDGKTSDPSASGPVNTQFALHFDDIIIVETNNNGTNPGVAAMVLAGVTTGAISIYCTLNPKACFGSCPTFYVPEQGVSTLVGEGFSSSIARSLEDTDVDLIDLKLENGAPLQLIMKNEAMETHLVNKVNILSANKKVGNRVIQSSKGDFYEISDLKSPLKALYNSQSVLDKVANKDNKEWFSLADTFNLANKEELFLEFINPNAPSGLIIEKRQTLMTTYLFYHFLSLLGNATTHYLAAMETFQPALAQKARAFQELLGGIVVYYLNEKGKWVVLDEIAEDGPIVTDSHLITLPVSDMPTIKLKLHLNQGLWRINTLSLGILERKLVPETHCPIRVTADFNGEAEPDALEKLLSDGYLVTFPGETYTIDYGLSYQMDKEYFIESKGYYIEWMREEWLKDQNLMLARRAMKHPKRYLREMAMPFKQIEHEMEEIFWNTKFNNDEGISNGL